MRLLARSLLSLVAGVALVTTASAAPSHKGHRKAPPPPPSLSLGSPNEGHLENGRRLEPSREVRVLPDHHRWGLPQLVGLLERAAHRVAQKHQGAVMTVGDLSRKGGGDIGGHHSHESGRDADVGFYVRARSGRPLLPTKFIPFDENGRSGGGALFDDERNWSLVEALVTDPSAHVTHIFVAAHLRDRLLDHARRSGVSPAVRTRAAFAMMQPKHGLPHDDHFHVRIGCPKGQRGACVEYVTREHHDTAHGKKRQASRPVIARARKRTGTSDHKPKPLVAAVPAPADFDEARADAAEVKDLQDEGGELRVTH